MGHLITITLMTPAERDGENGVHRIGSRAWGLGSEASEKGMLLFTQNLLRSVLVGETEPM